MFDDDMISKQTFEKASRVAALSCFAIHKPRIFEKGENAEGGKIGQYVPSGKVKKMKEGHESAFVNLSDTEQMKKDYEPNTTGTVGFGFSNQFNFDKATWNESRYQALIFALTDREEEVYIRVLAAELGFK